MRTIPFLPKAWKPLILLAAILGLTASLVPNDYFLVLFNMMALNALVVLGLNLLIGCAGQISLGHGAFFGLGAYSSAIVTTQLSWPLWAGLLVALLVTALFGLALAFPTLRLEGHYLVMATLGFNVIVSICLNQMEPWTGGPSGLAAIPAMQWGRWAVNTDRRFFFFVWSVFLVCFSWVLNLEDSRIGRALKTIHDKELTARTLAVPTPRYKIQVFTLSAVLAGLAGFAYAHYMTFISPSTFDIFYSVQVITMVVVGGPGSLWGGLAGTVLLTGLRELLHAMEDFQVLAYGLLLTLSLVFFPQGLLPALLNVFQRKTSRKPRRPHLAPFRLKNIAKTAPDRPIAAGSSSGRERRTSSSESDSRGSVFENGKGRCIEYDFRKGASQRFSPTNLKRAFFLGAQASRPEDKRPQDLHSPENDRLFPLPGKFRANMCEKAFHPGNASIILPERVGRSSELPEKPSRVPAVEQTSDPVLRVENLSVHFGGLQALAHVSFTVHSNEIVAVIGPNGAGKTTLLNAVSGLVRFSEGKVVVREGDVSRKPAYEVAAAGVGRTFQAVQIFDRLTVLENIMVGRHRFGRAGFLQAMGHTRHERYEEHSLEQDALALLKETPLAPKAHEPASILSLYEKKLLEILRALAMEPAVLLLDEPVGGCTPNESRALMDWITVRRRPRMGMVLVEHDMNIVMAYATRIVVLHHGRILAEGTPRDIQKDPKVVEAYLGQRRKGKTIPC
ncbi:MAG: branched-chain amino acid ABC transporter ATP-binding protein/permease [Desulfosoma sp.]